MPPDVHNLREKNKYIIITIYEQKTVYYFYIYCLRSACIYTNFSSSKSECIHIQQFIPSFVQECFINDMVYSKCIFIILQKNYHIKRQRIHFCFRDHSVNFTWVLPRFGKVFSMNSCIRSLCLTKSWSMYIYSCTCNPRYNNIYDVLPTHTSGWTSVKTSWKHWISTSNYLCLHTGVPLNTDYGWIRPYVKAQCSMFTYNRKSRLQST